MDKKDFKNSRRPFSKEVPEFDQKVVDLARVTRVMAGGKRMRFRACVAIGNKKGQVGFGLGKGADVTLAVAKAVNRAKKNLITIPLVNETIPHEVRVKFKSARLLIKPAPKGTGIKAGGPVRIVLELAGVPNAVSKILGTNNKINNLHAIFKALSSFKKVQIKETKKKAVVETAVKEVSATKEVFATKAVVKKVTMTEKKKIVEKVIAPKKKTTTTK
jgi:small subunit ribosomal protein S5